MNATQTLKSLKLKAFTITLEPILEGFDSLTIECKPVKYMDALKSVSGKIDMGAFSKFQGDGAKDFNVMAYINEHGEKAFEDLEISARLQQDMYFVEGITNIDIVYDGEPIAETENTFGATEFKALIRTAYGEEGFDKLLAFINSLSGVSSAKKN